MTINSEHLIKIIEKEEISLLHFTILCLIKENNVIPKNVKLQANVNALVKKNLLVSINEEYILTEKAVLLLSNYNVTEAKVITLASTTINFDNFCKELYVKLKNEIFTLTGKYNFKNPSGKYLLATETELKDKLITFYKKFKTDDIAYNDIENSLLKYINNVINKNVNFPIRLVYYICSEKNNALTSEMLEDIINDKEEQLIPKQKFVDTKKLF